jgi:hypothetical protein
MTSFMESVVTYMPGFGNDDLPPFCHRLISTNRPPPQLTSPTLPDSAVAASRFRGLATLASVKVADTLP